MAIPHGRVKLGKKSPRVDKRTFQFKKYLKVVPPLPIPPAEVSWVMKIANWPMMLNDQLGDCVVAAMGHIIQQLTFYSGKGMVTPTDQQILKGYEDIGGYNPADPTTDQGCDMLTALNYWRQTGLAGHKILAYAQVDPLNDLEVRQAIQLFGNIFIGLALPLSAQSQNSWTVPDGGPFGDGSPGGWGGHCVPPMADSPMSMTVITWGERLKMSHNFFRDYCDEAYVVLDTEWIGANGLSPSQFNLAQLKADLSAL